MDNAVAIVGQLAHDPVSKNGRARFTLVHRKDRADGEPFVSFYEVQCFGDLASNVTESCAQGDEVIVMGKLVYREMSTDGKRGNRVEVLADHVGLNLAKESFPIASTD